MLTSQRHNMGADRPQTKHRDTKSQSILPLLLLGGTILLFFGVLVFKIYNTGEYEAPKLSPEAQAKLEKRLKEIDDSEQYALLASMNGWYPCLHSGHSTYYLLAGEVWKYGVTSKGEFGRYRTNFLTQNKVSYLIEFKGTFSECLKQEQIKLYFYPFLPENLARPEAERLPRPPYNPIMR